MPGCMIPTPGLEHKVNAFQRSKCGELRVVTVVKLTPLIGAYLPPSTLEHLLYLEEALICFWDQDTIVLWDLNSGIVQAYNPHSHQVTDMLMDFGMMDLLHHLL